ncbi:MAG: DUF892 family protein [Gemmatimonadota bacterium]
MTFQTPRDLLGHQLRTLYGAELQLLAAMPCLIETVRDLRFANALAEHRLASEGHVTRLETCLAVLKMPLACDISHGMSGLLVEMQGSGVGNGSRRLGHYELAGRFQLLERFELALYANACTLARALDELLIVHLLDHTMDDERRAEAVWLDIALEDLGSDAFLSPRFGDIASAPTPRLAEWGGVARRAVSPVMHDLVPPLSRQDITAVSLISR